LSFEWKHIVHILARLFNGKPKQMRRGKVARGARPEWKSGK